MLDDKSSSQARRPERETTQSNSGGGPITAIRLELRTNHPRGGVGRTENDGNFVLSRFAVKVKSKGAADAELKLASATADFSQDKYPIEHVIKNPNPRKNGWAVAPKQLEIHQAVFTLAGPFMPAEGTELEITLDHQFEFTYPGFSLGRFRLFLTSDDSPSISGELPAEVRDIIRLPVERRTAEQQTSVLNYYAGIAPVTRPLRDRLQAIDKEIAASLQTPIMQSARQQAASDGV